MSTGLKVGTGVMLVLFASWAYFQLNDPDPYVWVAFYSAAFVLTLLFLIGKLPMVLAAIASVGALAWGLYHVVLVVGGHEFFFDEHGREMLGAFVVAAWTGFVAYRLRTKRLAPTSA